MCVSRDARAFLNFGLQTKTNTILCINYYFNHTNTPKEGLVYSLLDTSNNICFDKYGPNRELYVIKNDLATNE